MVMQSRINLHHRVFLLSIFEKCKLEAEEPHEAGQVYHFWRGNDVVFHFPFSHLT